MTKEANSDENDSRVQRIVQLLDSDERGGYSVVAGRMAEARDLLHEIIADRLRAPLNQELARRPQGTLAEKQALVRWVNRELRGLGVAIKCPKTHKAAVLAAHPGYRPNEGRFQIGLIEIDRYRHKTVSSTNLFSLELIAHSNRREPDVSQWVQKSTRKRGNDRELT